MTFALPVVAVTVLSGLYTSAWGAFKDGPWEGFSRRTFPRSVLFSLAILGLLWAAPWLRGGVGALDLFQVFFLVMGIERLVTEIYKACFRAPRDPSRFFIPQQLTWFGRDVRRKAVRVVVGVLGCAGLGAVVSLPFEVRSLPAFLAVGFGAGLFVSCGGAYKDAPFEGFQPLKFLRSSLVLSAVSPLLWLLGPTPLGLLLFVNGGVERLLVEYYKSFVLRSVPGKFRPDLEIVSGRFLHWRHRLHHLALGIIVVVAATYLEHWR